MFPAFFLFSCSLRQHIVLVLLKGLPIYFFVRRGSFRFMFFSRKGVKFCALVFLRYFACKLSETNFRISSLFVIKRPSIFRSCNEFLIAFRFSSARKYFEHFSPSSCHFTLDLVIIPWIFGLLISSNLR